MISDTEVYAAKPANQYLHVACSACRHLADGYCEARGFYPIYPHIAMRLCGDYEVKA